MMRAHILNLDGRDRAMGYQAAQCAALGLEARRVRAVTPARLDPPGGDRWWSGWERPLRDTEKATLLSHRAAWAAIAAGGRPAVVLEDDAILSRGAGPLLAALPGAVGIDHVTLEARGRQKLLGRAHRGLPLRRLWQDRSGAAAYVLWPDAARSMLARTEPGAGVPALADAALCSAYGLRAWQAVPALAVQVDRAVESGLMPPWEAGSTIEAEPRPEDRTPRQRWRRAAAQARMGTRRMAHPRGRWVDVGFAGPAALATLQEA